ncbi:MAG: hypothetical protein KJ645_04710 [Planctomycetes bacterium]|nr:hypothetical protein [Planctomycetota bacterium]
MALRKSLKSGGLGRKSNPIHYRSLRKGSILIPCLFFLSLFGMTAIGFLTLTRTEVRISQALDEEFQARLAAQSAREYALMKIAADPDYTGETGIAFPKTGLSMDISVTPAGGLDHTLQCDGSCNDTRFVVRQTLTWTPRAYRFALAVGGDMDFKKNSRVLGDVYAFGEFKGEDTALITGDVYLYDSRVVLLDMGGDVIKVDGKEVPEIQGELYDDQDPLQQVEVDVTALQDLAGKGGMIITRNTTLEDQDLTGVIFIMPGINVDFKNVTIHGLIVQPETMAAMEMKGAVILGGGGVPEPIDVDGEICVKSGRYLKIIPDPAIVEDLAILAPVTKLKVEGGGAYLDAKGITIAGEGDFGGGGSAVMTGLTYFQGDFKADEDYLFQSPAAVRDTDPDAVNFIEYEMTVAEYSEP